MGSPFTVLFCVSIYFVPLATVRIVLAAGWLFWIIYILRLKTAGVPGLGERASDRSSAVTVGDSVDHPNRGR